MRTPVLLCVLLAGAVLAEVKTYITQPIEMGVEQTRENSQSDVITFYAFVRQDPVDDPDVRWILSFVNFTCDGSCAESTSNLCESSPRLNPGWESHPLEHYPHSEDPPAIHISRSMEVDTDHECSDGLVSGYDDDTGTAFVSGQLYLHTIRGCSETGCPNLLYSDTLPFYVTYNTESAAITGLGTRDESYVYDIHYQRNLWMSGFSTLIELKSTLQTLGDVELVSVPLRFENPTITKQETTPAMKIVGLTECGDALSEESSCSQKWYLQAISGDSQPGPVFGEMEITSDLRFSDGTVVQSLLYLTLDIKSLEDNGQTARSIDAVASVQIEGGEFVPYFSDMINPTLVSNGARMCLTLSTPDMAGIIPGAVRVCASQQVDLVADVSELAGCRTPNVPDLAVYEIVNLATGNYNASFSPVVEQSSETSHEYKVCFNAVAISQHIQVFEAYYTKATDFVEIPAAAPPQEENVGTTTPERKRQVEDTYISQACPVSCSWGEEWDPVLCGCFPWQTNWANDDWTWLWVFFIIFLFIVLVGLAALACCYMPDYCGSPNYGYPVCYDHGGHRYVVNKDPNSGRVYTSIVVDGDDNNIYQSPEVTHQERAQRKNLVTKRK